MIQFTLFSLVLCIGTQYAASSPVTDASNRVMGAVLRLHTEAATYWDAYDHCQREGGVLASPTTAALVQAMRAKMAEHKLESGSVFAGIASQAKGDRTLASFSNASLQWAAEEPSNGADEQCLALSGVGALADVSCARALPYFCTSYATPVTFAVRAPTCEEGYEWNPKTHSCYKFHRNALSFRLALAKCHSEGALLAIVNSDEEADVLETLFAKYPPNQITGAENNNYAIAGFRKYEDGKWATLYGETLFEAGYAKWTDDVEGSGSGDCGGITREGLLNSVSCTKKYAFICEISA